MKVVDSSGWLEYFAGSPAGARFAPAIQDSQKLLVPVICLYEVFQCVAAQRGEEEALQAAALMMAANVVEISQEVALYAAQATIDQKMPLASSLILAVARLHQAELWTQDRHFRGLDQVVYIE